MSSGCDDRKAHVLPAKGRLRPVSSSRHARHTVKALSCGGLDKRFLSAKRALWPITQTRLRFPLLHSESSPKYQQSSFQLDNIRRGTVPHAANIANSSQTPTAPRKRMPARKAARMSLRPLSPLCAANYPDRPWYEYCCWNCVRELPAGRKLLAV